MVKKIFFLIMVLVFRSFAEDGLATKYEVKIIERLVMDITGKFNPKVCVAGYPATNIYQYSSNLVITSCGQADIVISNSARGLAYDKPVIVVGSFETNESDVIGSIFWRKGRPQIVLIEKNIKRFNLTVPEEYRKYILKRELTEYVKADF